MDGMFYGCSNLEYLNLSSFNTEKVTIMQYIFNGCYKLKSLDLSSFNTSQVNTMRSMFNNCYNLTSATIGNSVESIGNQAFDSCYNLISVTCEAATPPTLDGLDVFYDTNNCPIYVPSGSVEEYKDAEGWSDYADRIQPKP